MAATALRCSGDAAPDSPKLPQGRIRRNSFTRDDRVQVNKHYEFASFLGEGAFGSVRRAICRQTGAERAVKEVALQRVSRPDRLEAEIEILKHMNHPHVVRLFEAIRDEGRFHLVLELCTGGHLLDVMLANEEGGLSEAQAAGYTRQMLSALCYLHAHQFAHRDVKLENLLLQSPEQDAPIKLADFNLARHFQHGEAMTSKVGTLEYAAPEVWRGRYDERCDVWSAGVVSYILLSGSPPFEGDTEKELLTRVKTGRYSFPSPAWDHVGQDGKAFVVQLLSTDSTRRPSAGAALSAAWLQRAQGETSPLSAASPIGQEVVDRLQAFGRLPALKQVALTAAARQLPDSHLRALRDAFCALDANGDGMLSREEVCSGLAQVGIAVPPELDSILRDRDESGSGGSFMDYTEFLAAMADKSLYSKHDVCRSTFLSLDLDGDGKISQEELAHALSECRWGGHDVSFDAMLQDTDLNGDGCIDFEEFCTMMSTSPTRAACASPR